MRKPCENCPWRVDAPRGYWDPQHFVDIYQRCQGDGMNIMLCHKSNALPKDRRGDVPCQGWIRVMGFDAIGVRLLALQNKITIDEVEDTSVKLFTTFDEMLVANRIPLPRFPRYMPMTRRGG